MRDAYPEIRSLGAGLVVVGNGRPEHAADFRDRYALEFPVVVDPDLVAYRAAGLRRGLLEAISPRTLGHALRALGRGSRQGAILGDPWQLGGTFVIRPDGSAAYRHVSREAGDHPDPSSVLRTLRHAAGRG